MLKCLFGAICCFTLLGALVAGQEVQQSKLTQFLSTKCQKYSANAQIFDRLRVDVEDLKKYTKYAFSYLPKNKAQFCNNERKHLTGRMRAVTDNLAQCLPTEEQFLPDLIKKLFEGFLHFVCHRNAENVDSFFSTQGETCRNSLAQSEIDSCFQKIFAPVRAEVVTKTEVCDDIQVAEKCFNQILERQCPDFRAFQELNRQLFEQLNKACTTTVVRKTSNSSTNKAAVTPIVLMSVYLLAVLAF